MVTAEMNRTKRIGLFSLLAALCLPMVGARSDDIYLENGSHIIGEITGLESGKLVIEIELAGDILIPLEAIQSIETENEKTFTLDTGEVISGQLYIDAGRQKLLSGDDTIGVTLISIAAIGEPVEAASRKANWSGRAEFGSTFQDGNTDELDINTHVKAERESDIGRLSLLLRTDFGLKNDVKTDNEVFGETRYEYDLTERTFVLGISQAEFDEFEDLDLRLYVGGGLGYFFVNSDRQVLKGFGGAGYQLERLGNDTTTEDVIVPLGYEYRLKIRNLFQLRSQMIFFANVTASEDWRLNADNALEVPISSTDAWKIRIGIRNEYDHEPRPGIEEMDTTIYSSLVYDWE